LKKTIHLISCSIEEGPLSYPLGALCIQTALRTDSEIAPFIEVSHHRYTQDHDDPVKFALDVAERGYDVVGLSVYLYNRQWMEDFCTALRTKAPKTVLFAGGPEVSSDNFLLDASTVDFVIYGEGEVATAMAIKQLLHNKEITGPGIASGSASRHTVVAPVDLANTTSPILDNEDSLDDYQGVLWELTRGCPFNCSFCFEGRGEKSVRHIPFERIKQELKVLISHDIKQVFVLDPTFNLDKKRTVQILQFLVDTAPEDMHFTFEVRGELLDSDTVDLFSSLYCSLQIGLQSIHPEVDKFVGRTFNEKKFRNNMTLLIQHQIVFGLDLIIGLPTDTLEQFKASLDYAIAMKPSNIDIFLLAMLPSAPLAASSKELNIRHLEESPYTVIETPTMSEQDIKQALFIKDACDLLYTKGSASMWFGVACGGLALHPSAVFEHFIEWANDAGVDWEDDPYEVQDRFFTDMYQKHHREDLLPAILGFIELHQGISFFQETNESPVIELYYDPNDLAALDSISLEEFIGTFERFSEKQAFYLYQAGPTIMMEKMQ